MLVDPLVDDHIRKHCTRRSEKGLSPTAVGMVHTLLASSCKDAVKWKKIAVNPCASVTSPRQKQKEMKFLTVEQAQQLLDAARGHRLEAMIVLAVLTGMGAEVSYLRSIGRILTSRKAPFISIGRFPTKMLMAMAVYTERVTKDSSWMRTIPLPDVALEVLKAHRAKQREQRLQAGDTWKNLGVVFCTGIGSYYNQSNHHKVFHKILEAAGLPMIRFHDLGVLPRRSFYPWG